MSNSIGGRERDLLSTNLSGFDPDQSNRERRKLKRKIYTHGRKRTLYNDHGYLVKSGQNVCDCLQPDCPGCHFPCAKCRSPMCGHECRVNRKWMYDQVEIEGTDKVLRNRFRE